MSDTSMFAVRQQGFGDPGVLRFERVDRPVPLPTEVLVRVHAAGVNPVDWQSRAGSGVSGLLGDFPVTLGWDVSGVVEEVGFGVTTLEVGDEVYGMPWFPRPAKAYAEYVTAPARQFALKPARASHVQAAAIPLAGLTAWQALVDTAKVQPGQRVLVTAAAGGVGHLAVQFAKHLGAHVVGTASAERDDWLTGLGADEVVDYTSVRFEEVVGDIDVVIDLVGDAHDRTGTRSARTVRPGGLVVAIPSGVSPELAEVAASLGVRTTPFLVEPDGAGLAAIAALFDTGKFTVEVEEVFDLRQAGEAHSRGEDRRTKGKLVLTTGAPD
ncbi:NADP-dependent oxidoreductase [Umezawaea tangerina]|uniref:NADPH:quinone reductase-like Zn-dependent oxidoreductase n=1 Tax=Umezawaea tangerina TaxID=84725 RepID=A0A2T0T709_9PSEU|nr:NADP-dependent oxidoreductase [Umezawaea tangerina]PRY41428.1 NADPH:quinone reductase-like Zn-dependent oxidoreductase [Umezawaea tangerina]